ncbi:hypothetical protein [Chromobacterium haemolyticum]|uniref:hypothetical protein n=1 Tax=Chromobacterium haemolyticum TaxID=394935 RepID=UPI0024495957|nr:hypothetical protein [Chromobacterium haemolyticum]MDH0342169.1 hypothetical protein [Chromobacterium haemolyticum]
MLKLIKHIRSEQTASDKQANVDHDQPLKVHADQAAEGVARPAWRDMSSRLMDRLNTADDAAPELLMPGHEIPAPSPQQNKS